MKPKNTEEVKGWICDGCGVNLFSRDGEYRYVTCDDILIVLSGTAPPDAPPSDLHPNTKHWCQSCIKIKHGMVPIGITREGPMPKPTLQQVIKDLGGSILPPQEPPDGR